MDLCSSLGNKEVSVLSLFFQILVYYYELFCTGI